MVSVRQAFAIARKSERKRQKTESAISEPVAKTRKKRKSRSKFARIKHCFLFKIPRGDATMKEHPAWAKVILATVPVDIVLTEDYVLRSIELKGQGSTSECPGALCIYGHRDKFPHPVEGHADFTYTRAFIVSKYGKDGFPNECVAYEHDAHGGHLSNQRNIARMFDTPEGVNKLLTRIREKGPITIHLLPYRKRSEEGRLGTNYKGSGKRKSQRVGARLRFDVAKLGVVV